MKAFLIGIAALIVISVGAMLILENGFNFSSAAVYQSGNDTVRLR